jgi:hypothetical protein
MKTLTIHAASAESAREMLAALSGFRAELTEIEDSYLIVIPLDGADAEIVGVLNALQEYVTGRADGAAQVEFNGHSYVMHPEPEPGGL